MKRFLMPLLWVAVGTSTIALTSASAATAGISRGSGPHPARVHVINLHKAYEARLGHVRLGKIAGKFLPLGAKPPGADSEA